MKPIEFPEQTVVLMANPSQTEINGQDVQELPIWSDGEQTISCWKLSLWERLQVLFLGRVWLGVCAGHTQPPVWLSVDRTVFRDREQEPGTVPSEA